MGRGRFGRFVLLLGLLVITSTAVGAYADDPLSDLAIGELSFTPSIPVVRGDAITVTVLITRTGPPAGGPVRVEISWRRLDKEGLCGSVIETLAADGERIEERIDTGELTPGGYELVARVDPDDLIAESDETNNRSVAYFQVVPPRPELHPVSVNIDPASPLSWGETATVTAGVENTGRLSAGAFHVEFLMFPIYCYDPDTDEAWAVSADVPEDGSEEASWVFVEVEAPPADLGGLSPSIPDGVWIPFSSVQIPGLDRDQRTDVSNPFWTGQALRELLTGGGKTIPGSILPPLTSDEMERLERCVTTYAIEVVVGEPAGMAEEDRTNNRITSAISVRPSTLELPELVPVQVTFDRDLPLNWDDDMDAEVVVTNRGGSAISRGFDVSFYYRRSGESEWTFLDKESISRLGIEEDSNTDSVKATIDAAPSRLDLEPGSYELRVVVDEADVISERNEDNNELIIGFSVKGSEIHPVSLDLPSAPIHQGDTVSVIALVENTGDLSLHDFTVGFYLDDVRFDTFYYRAPASEDGLEEDDRTRVEGILDTSDLPPEEYTLRVVIDPDNRIPELDEGNNTISSLITILPPVERRAELQLTEVDLFPPSPIGVGTPLVVSAVVRNAGDIDTDRFRIRFSVLQDQSEGGSIAQPVEVTSATQDVAGLARSASRVIQATFATDDWPEGAYELRIRVDPPLSGEAGDNGEVDELDELNNEMIVSFTIGAPAGEEPAGPTDAPNLAFVDLSVSPSTSVDVGAPLQISGSVINRGREPAGPFRITLQWLGPSGRGYTVLSQDVTGLGVGESIALTPVTIQTAFPMGTYRLVGTVDARHTVQEQSEADNERTIEVTVGGGAGLLPDLVPVVVRFVPSSGVEVGDQVIAYVTVRNQGPLAVGPFSIAFTTADGTDYIGRDGLGPLAEVEVPYPLRPASAGSYEVSILVDPDDVIGESNEENNSIVSAVDVTAPAKIEAAGIVHDDSPVRLLAVDRTAGTVYAAWSGGKLRGIDRDGSTRLVFDAGEGITALALDPGAKTTVYLGTASGKVDKVDAATGALLAASTPLVSTVRAIALADGGDIYVGTGERLLHLDRDLTVLAGVDISGGIVGVAYDALRSTVYVISPEGLYAFDADLTALSDVSDFYGSLSCFALGTGAVLVGTDAGILYAYSYAMSHAGSPPMMVAGWRYPRSGTLPGGITSIVPDPRGTGTTYVTTSGGKVYAISLSGGLIWSYPAVEGETVSPILSTPAVDERSGRLFFGDDSGIPYILGSDGSPAFSVDVAATSGAAIRSSLVVDERREETESGRVLVRTYYYGAEDGWVYRIDSLK